MTEIAQTQIQRLVTLVAWMSQRDTGAPIRYRDAARQLGTSEVAVKGDLQVLLNLTDNYKPWLGSLSVALTAGGFILASRGAFRRPFRLSRDEALALILGLIGVRGGRELATKLGRDFGAAPDTGDVERAWALGPTPGERVAQMLAMARRARDERRKLELLYSGSSGEPSRRVVQPHQVVQAGGTWYLVAWCEKSAATRRFRVERILELAELDASFTPRRDLKSVKGAKDLLSADSLPTATVAFNPSISRWIRERYPAGKESKDGRYLVTLPVADPNWLAREVLQYGAEAEVVVPEAMREFLRGRLGD
jgi:proteasome accessory factor C